MNKSASRGHKLSGIPTIYEETHKLIDSKELNQAHIHQMEEKRIKKHSKAILELINKCEKSKIPLLERINIEKETYQEVLGNILNLQNHDTFETMMLLFEYMEKKRSFRTEKLTGTELLKLGGYKGTRQIHRSIILKRIESYTNTVIKILNPEKSVRNYKSKTGDLGLVYTTTRLLTIKEIVHSIKNPSLVKELRGIEFLPEYIQYIQQISRRYIPLETIRKISKDGPAEKTRHFLYKLCFKFASVKQNKVILSLEECMNLGKFYNQSEGSLKRKWQPIEKALIKAQQHRLIEYRWILKTTREENQIQTLQNKHFKYIEKVEITRLYHLNNTQINSSV